MAPAAVCYRGTVTQLDESEVANLLRELGRRTALTGGDSYFRSRAYLRAADSLAALGEPLDRMIAQDRLRQVPGIGRTIADIVAELHRTGTHPLLEKLRQHVPESVLDLLSIPGPKPEKIHLLCRELGIRSLGELEAAARADRLKGLKGLGPALQRQILQGLEMREQTQGARHLHRAAELIDAAIANLERADPGLARIVAAGDIGRGGGYRPAVERDPAMVQRDIARGYYTADEAVRLFTRPAAAE